MGIQNHGLSTKELIQHNGSRVKDSTSNINIFRLSHTASGVSIFFFNGHIFMNHHH
jgi:hypothetical protein